MSEGEQDPPLSASDEAELQGVPVFPLPRAVLFPGTHLPLHIFEPRYRDMMADCIEHERQLMVVAQLTGEWKTDYHGSPPIRPVAGVGRIEHARQNPDGTYDFQLLGLSRVSLSELPMEGLRYRRARAVALRERLPDGGLSQGELTSLFTQAAQVTALVQRREPRFALLASPDDSPARLVDKVADQFVGDAAMRQELLEILDVGQRMRRVTARLSQLQLALLSGEDDDGERTLH